ncbi:hypothetical protein LN042_18745 [Kitasatospora sp. RB6PN24]|uniref:hypothetical protein n=1 Tax=Kitasatospora humi TaxID=2893891 RepID=UPI001E44C23E|nr:hypothetical protein [Kitasatospora humi]MCC9309095.1 hypothetical protein [Kitasatospora humi]
MATRETWTTDEFGASHEGMVGVLLADGTTPGPVSFPMMSGGNSHAPISHWSVYDGSFSFVPRAQALRAVCSCGWTGPEHQLDWDEIGDQELAEAGGDAADACATEWDTHTAEVQRSTIPLPETITALLSQLAEEIEKLAKTSPLAALRASRQLEVTAAQTAYWPAHDARGEERLGQAAAALGLNADDTRHLLARFGRWNPYS